MIDYLTNTTYNPEIRDDISQELTIHVFEIYKKIENEMIVPENIDNYIYISLKHYREKLLKKSIYQSSLIIDDLYLEKIKSDDDFSKYFEIEEDLEISLQSLSADELFIVKKYFYENKTMAEIGEELNISQQAISKKLKKILNKLKENFN